MSWIITRKQVGRVAVLALMVVAFVGPWTFTLDGVPPPEWCREPNFITEAGRCAALVPGMTIVSFAGMAFSITIGGLLSGGLTLPSNSRDVFGIVLFTLAVCLVVLPFFITLLRIWHMDSRRWRIFQLAAWGAAAVLSLLFTVFESELRSGRYWGLWLYVAVAVGAIIVEARGIKDGGYG